MAVDEALLESVSNGRSDPVIRLYGFSPATLSVGRFQRALDELDSRRAESEGLTFVRRPTGGRAVLHAGELTYAVIIGRGHLPGFSKREVYRFIVPFLLAGLSRLGLPEAVSSTGRGNPLNPDCFASTGEYEIDSPDGRKLIGSAQMITRTAVLQHGSIPLTDAGRSLTPYLKVREPESVHVPSTVSREAGREVGFEEARSAFAEAARELFACREDDLSAEEREETDRLFREKYTSDTWNRMY